MPALCAWFYTVLPFDPASGTQHCCTNDDKTKLFATHIPSIDQCLFFWWSFHFVFGCGVRCRLKRTARAEEDVLVAQASFAHAHSHMDPQNVKTPSTADSPPIPPIPPSFFHLLSEKDPIFLVVFLAIWCGMGWIANWGFQNGDFSRMTNGVRHHIINPTQRQPRHLHR